MKRDISRFVCRLFLKEKNASFGKFLEIVLWIVFFILASVGIYFMLNNLFTA